VWGEAQEAKLGWTSSMGSEGFSALCRMGCTMKGGTRSSQRFLGCSSRDKTPACIFRARLGIPWGECAQQNWCLCMGRVRRAEEGNSRAEGLRGESDGRGG
jgi:hypothetical protein